MDECFISMRSLLFILPQMLNAKNAVLAETVVELRAEDYLRGYNSINWLYKGLLSRIGAPAVVCLNGSYEWCMYGIRHRVGGPAFVIAGPEGWSEWRRYGRPYRDDGPATIMHRLSTPVR